MDGNIDIMEVLAINKMGFGRKTKNLATTPLIKHAQTVVNEETFEYVEAGGESHNKSINHKQGTSTALLSTVGYENIQFV